MSHLTVTEKEHWKERISRRIDKAIEAVYAEQPSLRSRIAEAAQSEALKSLGLFNCSNRSTRSPKTKNAPAKQKESA